MEQKPDLMDKLHRMVGCEFLSSLKEPRWRFRLLQAILEIEADEYPYDQWSRGLSYLFDEDIRISSAAELRALVDKKTAEL